MKVKVQIECTPQEARAFFGMPDLAPLHDEIVAKLGERIGAAAAGFDPDAALKAWMGASGDGMNQLQEAWKRMFEKAGKGPA